VKRHALHTGFWVFGAVLSLTACPLWAQAPANSVPVRTYTGYYNDTAVYFAAFETNSASFAAVNGVVFAPRLSQVNDAALRRMIFFMNGTGRQTVVLETQPGQSDYNPLWQVVSAWWQGPEPMPLITNFAAAAQWSRQGRLLVQDTGIILNAPVFMINRTLDLQGGTLAPTISPSVFMGINPAIRTAYFQAEQGYYNGLPVSFLALEHAPGEIDDAPGAIPVPTISTDALGHSGVADFYEVEGQLPVIDSVPFRQVSITPGTVYPPTTTYGALGLPGKPTGVPPQAAGQTGQPGISQDTGAGYPAAASLYSPIWHVHAVTFNQGAPRPALRSVAEIQQAAAQGLVTVAAGQPDRTFNCPVPFYYQAGITNPSPVYTPPGGTTTPPSGTTPGTPTPPTGTY
jgi:hypothetical protein